MIVENIEELDCKVFKCFSQRLSHEIQMQLGILPTNRYQHKNGKIVTVFVLTKQLSEFLKKWTEQRPNKGGDGNGN